MAITAHAKLTEQSAEVEKLWYVPPKPPVPEGWHVYTLDRVLAIMQRCVPEPEKVRRTSMWVALAIAAQCVLTVIQGGVMLLACIPVVSSLLESFDSAGWCVKKT